MSTGGLPYAFRNGAGTMSCVTNRVRFTHAEPPPTVAGSTSRLAIMRNGSVTARAQSRRVPIRNVEYTQQGNRLGVVPLLEVALEMEAYGRQTDETQDERGSQSAFEPVQRIGMEAAGKLGQPRKAERTDGRRAGRQRLHRREVRFLDHFREDFCEDAGVGQRDREHARRRSDAEHLDQQQRPEQLVDRAQERRDDPHGAR